jgi:hypothetical protein
LFVLFFLNISRNIDNDLSNYIEIFNFFYNHDFLEIFGNKVESTISQIAEYYPVTIADETYEDFDTYVTTTTTTTTYTYGVFTD